MSPGPETAFPARILMGLARRGRKYLGYLRYLTHEFARAPGLEIDSYINNRRNRGYARQIKAWTTNGIRPDLEAARRAPLPKIIWMYWAQGVEDAPFIVKRCVESWQRHNPEWDVRVLDAQTVSEVVDLSDVPDVMPQRVVANMMRLRLLTANGGVWADATTLCHRPLDDWLPLHMTSGFFAFKNPGSGRQLDSWFLVARPGNPVVSAWLRVYSDYITHCRTVSKKYFMVMFSFNWAMKRDAEARAAWGISGALPALPTFHLMAAISGEVPLSLAIEAVEDGLPLSKLSWKIKTDPAEVTALLDQVSAAEGARSKVR